ncbi:tyrosine-type recombinase/integrase [Campylobacter canadensis]|uniref:Tyrosine-type recombinase/integrase n=1 Tax=Campylobacter canadensis TaxID=449520 RepID=A0ABS7WSK0_9BACT|nr:tyrosine-type recombinase/integrase [Campylobacter canadensis]MBZ7987745.1 tyrosine-type recombinase/integrase [Campylobacter canadensis]MBZ7994152.1 tyrosine-type recombinase/integrase [Campylobacter canadensis]MBZ7997382.1 tyrosine-type recombinase/integrase [Campylobacter canadensis]MBZ7999054.1 tyrosine-type recombinase/integrase [Campylobacter canadensis]MBZ7999484.1 tyrosine-type recombinase/integrase [Campylobacter canadensis]
MKYPLDCEDNFSLSLLFWIKKFIKYKINSLSNSLVDDKDTFTLINQELSNNELNLKKIKQLSKQARNIGLIGINTYFLPLEKFYKIIITYKLYSLRQIDEELVSEILNIITSGLSDASKKNYRMCLINFFNFISKQNEDENENSYSYNIELKRWGGVSSYTNTKLPEYMNEEQMKLFLQTLEEFEYKNFSDRNKLAIKIILFTGIRVSEMLRLKPKDIYIENDIYCIRIKGKGNKHRIVLLNKNSIEKHLLNINKTKDEYIFTSKNNKLLTQAYISRLIENLLIKAGIRKEKNGAHMLRHSFATLLYKKEKDLVLVQEALGHASLNTSRIYTHFDNEKLKLAANIASTLSKNDE